MANKFRDQIHQLEEARQELEDDHQQEAAQMYEEHQDQIEDLQQQLVEMTDKQDKFKKENFDLLYDKQQLEDKLNEQD